MLDDQQAQDDLDSGGGTTVVGSMREAAQQVGFDRLEDCVVRQQDVDLRQDWVHLHTQSWNTVEQVDRVIAVAQHTAPQQSRWLCDRRIIPSTGFCKAI